MKLEVPSIAENGAAVPVAIEVNAPMTPASYVKHIYVIGERGEVGYGRGIIADIVRLTGGRAFFPNNLKQLGLALHNRHDTHGGFPAALHQQLDANRNTIAHSWTPHVLPYIEQDNLFKQFDLQKSYQAQTVAAQRGEVPAFFCPSRRGPGKFSVAEGWDVVDTSPPPNPTSPSKESRFSAANHPPGNENLQV